MARSNEAKALGIKEGTPYFQMQQQFPNQEIAVFSSNYELYGDLTSRVVMIISQEAPAYFRYSIDQSLPRRPAAILEVSGAQAHHSHQQHYPHRAGSHGTARPSLHPGPAL